MLDQKKLNDVRDQLQELDYSGRVNLVCTLTTLSKGQVKKEIEAVNRRMAINKIFEDWTGRSVLDARASDITKCEQVIAKLDNSDLMLKELQITLNLIKEYQE